MTRNKYEKWGALESVYFTAIKQVGILCNSQHKSVHGFN